MDIATATQKRSSLIDYCASSNQRQFIQELSSANDELVQSLCTSPLNTEILVHIFDTLYNQNKLKKNASKTIECLLSLHERCVAFYLKTLQSSHVITKKSLTSHVNLFYLLNICDLPNSARQTFKKEIQELSIYGIEKDIAEVFIKNQIEISDINVAKYFMFLIHTKVEVFRKKLSERVKYFEKKEEFDAMLSVVRENPKLQYSFLAKVAEICIVLYIILQLCIH